MSDFFFPSVARFSAPPAERDIYDEIGELTERVPIGTPGKLGLRHAAPAPVMPRFPPPYPAMPRLPHRKPVQLRRPKAERIGRLLGVLACVQSDLSTPAGMLDEDWMVAAHMMRGVGGFFSRRAAQALLTEREEEDIVRGFAAAVADDQKRKELELDCWKKQKEFELDCWLETLIT